MFLREIWPPRTLAFRIAAITLASDSAIIIVARFRPSKPVTVIHSYFPPEEFQNCATPVRLVLFLLLEGPVPWNSQR